MYKPRRSVSELNEKTGADRWLVSYADFMTLLFALFVVLFSLATVQKEQFSALSQAISELFQGGVSSSASSTKAEDAKLSHLVLDNAMKAPLEFDRSALGESASLTTELASQERASKNQVSQPKTSATKQQVSPDSIEQSALGSSLEALEADLQQSFHELSQQGLVHIARTEDWLTIELSSSLLFASGSAAPSQSTYSVSKALTELLSRHQNYLRIRGYTDSNPIQNELFPSNWELSSARAIAFLRLFERFGVEAGRMAAEAYGEYSPSADNAWAEGRAKNRKVVVAVSKYAYVAKPSEAVKRQDEAKRDSFDRETHAEPEKVRIIRLPHGGIRITTRAAEAGEREDSPTQQED